MWAWWARIIFRWLFTTSLSDQRGRGALVSWEDMVCITEITEGHNLPKSCVYVWEAGIWCDHKTLLIQMSLFFQDTSALLVVLEGQLLQLQLLPTGGTGQHRWESVCESYSNYKHGNTLNTPGFLWDQRVPAHQVNLVFPKMKTCRVSISNSHRST